MTATNRAQMFLWTLFAVLLLAISSCNGSSSTTPAGDENAPTPAITSVTPGSANAGTEITIAGMNFGESQAGGSVKLNGTDFTVVSWSDTEIKATVVEGMTSGIVVVTRDGKSSQNGQEAQLFIPNAPPTTPIVFSLSPDYGRVGTDIIAIIGAGFGSEQGTSLVYFSYNGATTPDPARFDLAIGPNSEPLVSDKILIPGGGTNVTQWTKSSISVKVPEIAASGPVYVKIGETWSNPVEFTSQPAAQPIDPPVITDVSPPGGPVGAVITITGNNFGNTQSGGTITINGVPMFVLNWTNTELMATVPAGATSGLLTATVAGRSVDFSTQFIVANLPVITGVSPAQIKIGSPVTIFGSYFGGTQGTGKVTIGGANIPVSTWANNEITIAKLPAINSEPGAPIDVVVTTNDNLPSAGFTVTLRTDLSGNVTVTPSAGAAGTTVFHFSATVVGGSGNYEYSLMPDDTNPGTLVGPQAILPLDYTYGIAAAPKTYGTKFKVVDKSTGDTAFLTGPQILLVGPGQPVISSVELLSYNYNDPAGNIPTDAPKNDLCYWRNPNDANDVLYYDFTFLSGAIYYTSPLLDLMSSGTLLPSQVRDFASFKSGSTDPRPYGHRYEPGTGSSVVIKGLNFGATPGEVYLNYRSDTDKGTLISSTVVWAEDSIQFTLPAGVVKNLSGTVAIFRFGETAVVKSLKPLICSAMLNAPLPATVSLTGAAQSFVQAGRDLTAPISTGISGDKTYMIWQVNANYTDPWTSAAVTRPAVIIQPVPITIGATDLQFQFAPSSLGVGANLEVLIEVFDSTRTQSGLVIGELRPGTYRYFLWTGALGSGSAAAIARSGVFSEIKQITVTP